MWVFSLTCSASGYEWSWVVFQSNIFIIFNSSSFYYIVIYQWWVIFISNGSLSWIVLLGYSCENGISMFQHYSLGHQQGCGCLIPFLRTWNLIWVQPRKGYLRCCRGSSSSESWLMISIMSFIRLGKGIDCRASCKLCSNLLLMKGSMLSWSLSRRNRGKKNSLIESSGALECILCCKLHILLRPHVSRLQIYNFDDLFGISSCAYTD